MMSTRVGAAHIFAKQPLRARPEAALTNITQGTQLPGLKHALQMQGSRPRKVASTSLNCTVTCFILLLWRLSIFDFEA
jgi:hypothetical protein